MSDAATAGPRWCGPGRSTVVSMPLLLFLAFLAVPLLELWVIVQVGDVLGFWPTLLVLVADSVLGAVLVRREGGRAWRRFRDALGEGRIPDDEIIQGALLLLGGALLLTPGFVTDLVGLALVLPVTRDPVARLVRRRAVPVSFQVGTGMWNQARRGSHGNGGGAGRGARPATGADGGEPGIEVLSVERDEPARVEPPRDPDDDAPDEPRG